MLSAVPEADQIRFLLNIQRLLTEGLFTASYKYALLMALADLAVEKGADTRDPLPLTTLDLAEKFVGYYWRQAVPFVVTARGDGGDVLRQNSDRQAAVIRLVTDFRVLHGDSIAAACRNRTAWHKLLKDVDQVIRAMPLWKLQIVGGAVFEFLYSQAGTGTSITLLPGVTFCFRQFHGLIAELVKGAWARLVRQYNLNVLGDTADLHLFLFGSERARLAPVREFLTDLQQGSCFYCHRAINGQPEVDHFIPWALYPMDLGHNLVVAHRDCNSAKRDLLAAEDHLVTWMARNHDHGTALTTRFEQVGVAHSLPSTLRIARWAYGRTAISGGLTWRAKNDLVELTGAWAELW